MQTAPATGQNERAMRDTLRTAAAVILGTIAALAASIGLGIGRPDVASADAPLGNGTAQVLAAAVPASAAQVFRSASFGYARTVTVCVTASAPTTFTITGSVRGGTAPFAAETLVGSATSANVVLAAAGSLCEAVTPTQFVNVATSAAATVTIEAQASY